MEAFASLSAASLKAVVSRLGGIAEGRALPAYLHAEIGLGDGTLDVIFRNQNMTVMAEGIPATRSGGMVSFGVARVVLENIAANLKGDTVQLSFIGDSLEVSCGKAFYRLQTIEPTAFPPRPRCQGEPVMTKLNGFLAAMSSILMCTGGTRAYSECVSLDRSTMAATDGFRLGIVNIDAGCDAVITKECAKALKPIFSGMVGDLLIVPDSTTVSFSSGGVTATLSKSAVKFPNVKSVLPSTPATAALYFAAEDLIDALTAVIAVLKDDKESGKDVTLTVEPGVLSIRSHGGAVTDATTTMSYEAAQGTKPATQQVTVNGRFLIDAVRAMGEDKVLLEFRGDDRPVVIRGPGVFHVINTLRPT